jgi:protease-4
VAELAVRPLGNRRFTIFGDYAIQKNQKIADAPWSAGAALEVLAGVNLTGRYFDNEAFTVGLNVSFGRGFAGGQGHYEKNRDRSFNTYSVGIGDYSPNLFTSFFFKKSAYVALNLKGRVDYQAYRWFDVNTRRFMDILQDIRNAANDPRVEVLALNLSAMRVLPEHAWEIREELKSARTAGKKVIIFIDNAGMTGYHLASVADVVMMDPQGSLMLPGYVLGRTYLKGTLDKLGLGFDEWRFFKYKSAAEVLSREDMSEADREQTRDFTDDMYDLIKKDVSESRGFSAEKFDQLINESIYFLPEDALKEGLVDTLCRWSNLKGVVKFLTGKKKIKLPVKLLAEAADTYQDWGEAPQIALVYGLGVCAMDQGIKARWLENVFLKLADKKSVKAVVFRVDSPGGEGVASDVVAEALRKCAKEKPVIVSQGQVAGSGGYWISMYGDTILAGPAAVN